MNRQPKENNAENGGTPQQNHPYLKSALNQNPHFPKHLAIRRRQSLFQPAILCLSRIADPQAGHVLAIAAVLSRDFRWVYGVRALLVLVFFHYTSLIVDRKPLTSFRLAKRVSSTLIRRSVIELTPLSLDPATQLAS